MRYIVYKAINLKNNKIYIGITTKSLEKRIFEHKQLALKNSTKCRKFYSAIRKYNFKNFKFEIIKQTNNLKKLYKMEQYYIKYYQANTIKGYNLTKGGRGNIGWRPSKQTKQKIGKANKRKLSGNKNPSKRVEIKEKISIKLKQLWNQTKKGKLLKQKQSKRMKINNPMKKLEIRKQSSLTRIKNKVSKGKNNPNYKHGHYCK